MHTLSRIYDAEIPLQPVSEAADMRGDALAQTRGHLEALRHLDANWDSFGSQKPQTAAIIQAETMLSPLLAAAEGRSDWRAPGVSADETGAVMLEWWHGERTLTLVFDGTTVTYLRAWGLDIANEMEEGALAPGGFRGLWDWFRGRQSA